MGTNTCVCTNMVNSQELIVTPINIKLSFDYMQVNYVHCVSLGTLIYLFYTPYSGG